MPFSVDYGPTNDALQKMSWVMMQDWLQRRGAKQSMDYLKKSGEMWTEKAKSDAELESQRMQQQYDQTMAGKERDFYNWVAQQPEAKALMSRIQMKQLNGEDYEQEKAQLENLYTQTAPNIEGLTTDYDTSGKNVVSLLGMFDPGAAADLTGQAMRNRQSDKDLLFKYRELAFNKSKEGKDASDKIITRYLTKIDKLRSFYTGVREGNPVTVPDPTRPGLPLRLKKALAPEQAARVDDILSQIGTIESKVIADDPNDAWTKTDIEWLDDAWNYTENDIAMQEAGKLKDEGDPRPFDKIVDDMKASYRGEKGTTERFRGVGAPIDQRLAEATEGEFTFANDAPSDVKKKLFDIFNVVKKESTNDKGERLVTDAQIFASIFNEYPGLQQYLVKVKELPGQDEVQPPPKPKPEAETITSWKKPDYQK